MDKAKLEEFKKILLAKKEQIINSGLLSANDDLKISSDDLPDEADIASNVINQQVSFNIRHRELNKLRHIDAALDRIHKGTYGHCEECEGFIGHKRLTYQPWTTLCITHAEEKEREDHLFRRQA